MNKLLTTAVAQYIGEIRALPPLMGAIAFFFAPRDTVGKGNERVDVYDVPLDTFADPHRLAVWAESVLTSDGYIGLVFIEAGGTPGSLIPMADAVGPVSCEAAARRGAFIRQVLPQALCGLGYESVINEPPY